MIHDNHVEYTNHNKTMWLNQDKNKHKLCRQFNHKQIKSSRKYATKCKNSTNGNKDEIKEPRELCQTCFKSVEISKLF